MFDNSLIMEKQTYACFSNAKWFRGIVTDIYINSTLVNKCLNVIYILD